MSVLLSSAQGESLNARDHHIMGNILHVSEEIIEFNPYFTEVVEECMVLLESIQAEDTDSHGNCDLTLYFDLQPK